MAKQITKVSIVAEYADGTASSVDLLGDAATERNVALCFRRCLLEDHEEAMAQRMASLDALKELYR